METHKKIRSHLRKAFRLHFPLHILRDILPRKTQQPDWLFQNWLSSFATGICASVPDAINGPEGSEMNLTARSRYRVAVAIEEPYVAYNSSSDSFYGYCIDFLEAIGNVLGIDYDIKLSSDKHFGHIDQSGEWTGIVRDLMMNKVDIGAGALWITHDRQKVVDYTLPFYKANGITIMMRKQAEPHTFLWFLTILDYHIWLNSAAMFLVTSILLYLFERFSPYNYRRALNGNGSGYRFANLKECFWFCLLSLTPEGGGGLPRDLPGKLIAALWWLFVFIIVAAYNANLAAYESLNRLERHIESVDDLWRQYQVDYSTTIDSPTYRYFENLKDNEELLANLWKQMSFDESVPSWKKAVWEYPVEEKYTKVYNAMEKTGFLSNLQEAVDRVRKINSTREFAFIGESIPIRYLAMTNCDLREVGKEFGLRPYAFAVKKGSPLRRKLNNGIKQIQMQGIPWKLEKKWWDDNPMRADCSTSNRINTGFTLEDMKATFLLIFAGIFLASVTLCLQYCYCSIQKKRDKKQQRLFVKTKIARKITELQKKIAIPTTRIFARD